MCRALVAQPRVTLAEATGIRKKPVAEPARAGGCISSFRKGGEEGILRGPEQEGILHGGGGDRPDTLCNLLLL